MKPNPQMQVHTTVPGAWARRIAALLMGVVTVVNPVSGQAPSTDGMGSRGTGPGAEVRGAASDVLMPVQVESAPVAPDTLRALPIPASLDELLGLEDAELRPLPLAEALTLALDRNRDIREARLQVEEAAGVVTEAWSNVYPRVDLSAGLTRNISPPVSFLPRVFFEPTADPGELVPVSFGLDNVWSSTLSLEQPLFEAQAFIGVGAASRFRSLQDEQLRGTIQEVVTRVRTTYYELLMAEEQARLIQRSLERVVESLDETRALRQSGLASEFDVLRLEVELANLTPQLRRAANAALRVERELVTELDLPEGTRLQPEGTLSRLDPDDLAANDPPNRRLLELVGVRPGEVAPAPRDAATLEALLNRAAVTSSTLLQAGLDEELKLAELRAEQADFLPRVALFGTYQIQAQQDGGLDFFGSSAQRGYGRLLGIQVSVPVFTGFQRTARVDQRQAALRASRLRTETARDRLRDDLKNVLDDVEEALLRSRAQRMAVMQATRGFEIASAEFREGLAGRLQLTDAEVALRESEFNYAEAVFDYLRARARLDELVGEIPALGGLS